jgi:hypothetical protein
VVEKPEAAETAGCPLTTRLDCKSSPRTGPRGWTRQRRAKIIQILPFKGSSQESWNLRYLAPEQSKFMGFTIFTNSWVLSSRLSTFSSDVFHLIEKKRWI